MTQLNTPNATTETIVWSEDFTFRPMGSPWIRHGLTDERVVSARRCGERWEVRIPGVNWVAFDELPATVTDNRESGGDVVFA